MRGAPAEERNPFPSRIVRGFGFSRLNHPRRPFSVSILVVLEHLVVTAVGLGLMWLLPR